METYFPLIKVLLIALGVFAILYVIKLFIDRFNENNNKENYDLDLHGIYTKKPYFFSPSELKMYYLLRDFLLTEYKGAYAVFLKVGLQDFLYVNKSIDQYKTYYNKIGQKHIDFLVVDQNNHCNAILAIELNGSSHKTHQMETRDDLVSTIYKEVNLDFLVFQNNDLDDKEYILEKVRNYLMGFYK